MPCIGLVGSLSPLASWSSSSFVSFVSPIAHGVRSKKWRHQCEDYSSRIILSYGSLRGIWCKLHLREDMGENPLGPKVCLRSTDEAENRNRGVVQKRSVVWKSPPDSGMLDSDWYGLCFNLAQFTLHSSWHVLRCDDTERAFAVYRDCQIDWAASLSFC